jgi:Protein of unknown function (DUF2809)
MPQSRASYFILIISIINIGIFSRKANFIPLFIGDILWGLMVFFMVRFLFIKRTIKWVSLASLLFCYAIEISQLYQAPWINNIRHTVIGGLVLGLVFSWGDMLCYTVGVGIGILIEVFAIKEAGRV